MPTTEDTGAVRADLFVREDLPKPARKCRQRAVARLERLAAEGAITEFEVTSWAKRVPLSAGESDTLEHDRFNEFSAWAREEGVRIAPFFDTRDCYSMESGEKRTELVLPAACIAVYEDGELRTVAPHATASRTTSLEDCLDSLARDTREDRRLLAGFGTAD